MIKFFIKNKKKSIHDSFTFGDDRKYRIDVANTLSKRKEAYQLIYKLYRKPETGFADFDSSEMWYSLFYAHPDTCTFIVRERSSQKVVGALTVVIDSELGLPMQESYPEQLSEMRRNHKKCAEIISLGIHENYAGDREILIQLIKFSYLYARGIKGVSDYLIMICPRHAFFYEKKFLYRPIGEEMPCSKVKNKTVKLYNLNLDFAEKEVFRTRAEQVKVRSIFNYFKTARESQETIDALKEELVNLNKGELAYFFQEQKSLFEESKYEEIKALENSYENIEIKNYLGKTYLENPVLKLENIA